MFYPRRAIINENRQMTSEFLGYNHNLQIGDGEFYDMKNMTSDYYPVLAPRKKRGKYILESDREVTGMIAKDKLYFVDGIYFRIDNDLVDMDLSTQERDLPKNLISIGSYVIVMPDRKWVNTVKKDGTYEWGNIDYEKTIPNGSATYPDGYVKLTLCTLTGEKYDVKWGTKPEETDGALWIDNFTNPPTLKKYSEDQKMWVSIPTTYLKISAPGIGVGLNQYDGVEISGFADTGDTWGHLDGYHTLWDVDPGGNYIIITGIPHTQNKQVVEDTVDVPITISRKMPIVDFIIESNNRLWGCRYGANAKGEIVNEIYASKQGDFKNWYCFMQISTDSWTQGVGSDGPFTGAITHGGYPIFFKEGYMHKVYGSIPANFQVQTTQCRGVQQGSHGSLAIVNETLYYKSGNAVCAYDGSLPVEISSALGDVRYEAAVACAHGNKYYISMREARADYLEKYSLFVYDTSKGMWHKEDDFKVGLFCPYKDEIYAIGYEDGYLSKIITLLGSGTEDESKVPWMVETGIIGMFMPDMKYISKILIRMSLDAGSSINVSIQYDSNGDWEYVCSMSETSLRSFSVPIRPRRCDHFRIRIEGVGDGKIYSITKTIEQGSDRS